MPSRLRLLLVLCTSLCLAAGCLAARSATSLSDRLVAPGGVSPLMDEERIQGLLATLPNRSGHVLTPAGIPIFWRAIDPGDYRMRYRYEHAGRDASGHERADFAMDVAAPQPGSHAAPRGTVVLLHGWMMDGDSLLPWSLDLAQAGYRSISIDLRNHGRSGGGPAGYGTRESDDVVAVIRALRARGEVQGPLYLFGVSYGAATALFTAQKLGGEVDGVVAMESFANAGRGIRDMIPHMLASRPQGLVASAAMDLARWRYGGQNLDAVIANANQRLALNLDQVDVTAAARTAPACLLLLHGSDDQHIPVAHGRLLALDAPRAHYLEMPGENHLSLPMRLDLLAPTVEDWFAELPVQRHDGHCPAPLAPRVDAEQQLTGTPAAGASHS
ncbi:alpha/beta hydrolase family protein [Xanthomonas translucens]|uniref:alpha/beta hydrolase family protein n=1 Tax=Xanthomonas campestris pv. translucens TaxID=343 RepID=UPI001F615F19|nr:alpha/beta fold hydrolase [Xanthomonas translucens]UNT98246.1 alpha/beta fold hydrolase [Xanthomonas translucens pv. translucens]